MSVVINVHDDLARRLQAEAANRSVSVEKLAITILDRAVPTSKPSQDWGRRNRRALELIRKSSTRELSDRDQAELDQLQSWLDQQFESFDAGLLNQLLDMWQTVELLSAEPRNE